MITSSQAWQDAIGHYDSLIRVSPKRYVLLVETCRKLFQNIAVTNYFAPLFSHGTLFLFPTDTVRGTPLMLAANLDASMTLMHIKLTTNEKRVVASTSDVDEMIAHIVNMLPTI